MTATTTRILVGTFVTTIILTAPALTRRVSGQDRQADTRAGVGQSDKQPDTPPAPLVTEGVTFAPNAQFAKGQTKRYNSQSSMTFRFPGVAGASSRFTSSTSMSQILRYRVRDTKPDGTTLLDVTSEGGRMLDAGSALQDLPKENENAARLLTLDRQSHIIAFKDQSAKNKAGALTALFSQSNLLVPLHLLPLPDKTVRVGESWTARYAAPGTRLSGEPGANGEDVSATLTLLGSQKFGDVNTIKIKQVLNVPFVTYADAQGRTTGAKGAQSRLSVQFTFTQLLNALPESGLLVRSEGVITGSIKFEGALRKQVPGDIMNITGSLIAVRIEDNPLEPASAPK